MHRIRPLCLLVAVLCSGWAMANDPVAAARLKLEGSVQLQFRPGDDNGALFLDAERIEMSAAGELFATGRAQLRRRGGYVFADQLHYWAADERVQASGQVRVERFGNVIWGDTLDLRRKDNSGQVDNARYQLGDVAIRGAARKVLFEGNDHYRLQQASFTTCTPGQDDWFIRTGELDLDFSRNVGVARHSSVEFLGLPVAYSPWMDFSLNGARKSGLLAPSIGSSSSSGSEITVPFYRSLAPNYDWEIAPRFMSKRGVAFNNHARYLHPSGLAIADLRAEILPGDRITDTNRYTGLLDYRQQFSPALSGWLQLQKASDDRYFTDLDSRISATSQVNLPRIGSLSWAGNDWVLTGRVERYQTLQDPQAPVTAPYARVPQLLFSRQQVDRSGAEWNWGGEWVEFSHPTLVSGRRLAFNPAFSWPLQTQYAYVTPRIGYNYTRYELAADRLSGADKAVRTRSLPRLSLDSTLFLERDDSWFGNAFVQTLEPRLYYVYIPYRDQSRLPNFDSSDMDFNFAQLFTDNQFAGSDRINNANQLTAALTSRVLEHATGKERLRLAVGQRFYFAEQKVTLSNPARKANSSDLILSLGGQVADSINVDTSWQFNQTESNTQRANLDIRYHPVAGRAINAGWRFDRGAYKQLDLSGQWQLSGKWWGVGRYAYSIRDDRPLERLGGLEYNAGCWILRLVGQRFVTDSERMSSSYFLQLELNDLARVGANPLDVLSRSIAGYSRINVQREPLQSDLYR